MFSSISSVFSSDLKGSNASVAKNDETSLPIISINESDRSEGNVESEHDTSSSVVKEPEGTVLAVHTCCISLLSLHVTLHRHVKLRYISFL